MCPVGPDGVVRCYHGEATVIWASHMVLNPNWYVTELMVYSTQILSVIPICYSDFWISAHTIA